MVVLNKNAQVMQNVPQELIEKLKKILGSNFSGTVQIAIE